MKVDRRSVYRRVLELVQPHKTGTSDVTGNIPAELKPLYEYVAGAMTGYAKKNPLTDFSQAAPETIEPLSYQERTGLAQIPGMMQANPLDALALQAIMKMPTYAGAGPSTGRVNLSHEPTAENYYSFFRKPAAATPAYDPNWFSTGGEAPESGTTTTPGNPPGSGGTTAPPPGGSTGTDKRKREPRVVVR